jgi:hypothetical protein
MDARRLTVRLTVRMAPHPPTKPPESPPRDSGGAPFQPHQPWDRIIFSL